MLLGPVGGLSRAGGGCLRSFARLVRAWRSTILGKRSRNRLRVSRVFLPDSTSLRGCAAMRTFVCKKAGLQVAVATPDAASQRLGRAYQRPNEKSPVAWAARDFQKSGPG